jgi:hypothetical protein
MRSRERLVEVLRSVNGRYHGTDLMNDFRFTADILSAPNHFPLTTTKTGELINGYAKGHPSPHIRELAAEALHYLKEDARNG